MKPRLFKTREGYLAFLARLRPGFYHAVILHDGNECTPSRCACKPWFRVEDATDENLLEGEEAERQWRKSVCS